RSSRNGSSVAERYARQAKLVTAMECVLPHEPSAAWFFVSQSSPLARAAATAFAVSFAGSSAVRAAAGQASKSKIAQQTGEQRAIGNSSSQMLGQVRNLRLHPRRVGRPKDLQDLIVTVHAFVFCHCFVTFDVRSEVVVSGLTACFSP